MEKFDYIVIGSGPGGADFALEAASHGATVALIEKDQLGGTCLNRGCIPTKAFLHLSEHIHQTASLIEDGLASEEELALAKEKIAANALGYRDRIVSTQRKGLEGSLKRSKNISVFEGHGRVKDAHMVLVEVLNDGQPEVSEDSEERGLASSQEIYAEKIIIATGSSPIVPPFPGSDLEIVYTSDHFLDERYAQEIWDFQSITIIGAGVIGMEMADYLSSIGKEVTMVEALDRVLGPLDSQISKGMQQEWKKRGITVLTNAFVEKIEESSEDGNTSALVYYEEQKKKEKKEIRSDVVLLSVGRRANTKDLFDSSLALEMERSAIKVNANFQSSIPSIYAIGDVRSGSMQLAHEASLDAKQLLAHFENPDIEIEKVVIPSCVYTSPELAQVGLTEEQAKEKGLTVFSSKISTMANARNLIAGGGRGFINLVVEEESLKLLGAQWYGNRATDLIDSFAILINQGLSLEEMDKHCHPHPSFVESIGQAIAAALAKAKA